MEEKVRKIVIDTLKIEENKYDLYLAAGDIPEWDSIRHVQLLQNVEKEFDISFDIADAIAIEDVSELVDMVEKYSTQK